MARHPARVLVVDDDAGIQNILQLAFTDEGYAVRSASHGQEDLEVLRSGDPA